MVCSSPNGSKSKYGVVGYNGTSIFSWTITSPSGVVMPVTPLNASSDSIEVNWGIDPEQGIYTFSVEELTGFGCVGLPFSDQVILNTNKLFIPFPDDNNQDVYYSCVGNSITLEASYFENGTTYLWENNTSETKQTYITTSEGTYHVQIVRGNDKSCSFDSVQSKFHPQPYVWLGNDATLFGNQTLELNVEDPLFTAYSWSTGATTPNILVDGLSGNQTIKVTITDINGCEASDDINIFAADYNNLRIAAAFTPNGDQINDTWRFPTPSKGGEDLMLYIDGFDAKVYNRLGKLVWSKQFLSNNSSWEGWDGRDLNGRPLPMDSYHYIIVFKINGKELVYKGSVTIVR